MERTKPRVALLTYIISSVGVYQHKYSAAFNAIRAVMNIEYEEKGKNKLPERIFRKYDKIVQMSSALSDKLKGIPLVVVEQYFFRKGSALNNEIYMMYGNIEVVGLKAVDIYVILEEFFNNIYDLAVEISDYYTIEIKLKRSSDEDEEIY